MPANLSREPIGIQQQDQPFAVRAFEEIFDAGDEAHPDAVVRLIPNEAAEFLTKVGNRQFVNIGREKWRNRRLRF